MVHLFQIWLPSHTIGIYCSAICTFLEPPHLHKASTEPVISKLMHHFYSQHPPSCKHFDPRDVEDLFSLLEGRAPTSSLTTFKFAWTTTTVLSLVTARHCSDLTLLCIDNQHLFLQHHAAIFIPCLVTRQFVGVIFQLSFVLSLTPMLIFVLFYVKAYLRCTELLRMKPNESCDFSFFWVTIDSISLSVLKPFLLG